MPRISIKLSVLLVICLFLSRINGSGQVSIAGPGCIVPSTAYQYLIDANWKDSSDVQICIKGGKFLDSTICYTGKPVPFLRLTWNGQDSISSISLHSSTGNTSFSVNLTNTLKGGLIDSTSEFQLADTSNTPPVIHCSAATGGNCNPIYYYQWQESQDNLSWKEIRDQISQDLQFEKSINKTTYYRRKVTEAISTSVQYSDVGIIIIY